MQFIDIMLALRRFWRAVAVSIVLALAMGFLATSWMPKTYTSMTEHFVQTTGSGTIAELQQGEVFAKARAQSYAGVANTPLVLQPVIDELELAMTVEEFSELVSVSVRPATVIISLEVQADTPAEAARRASALGAQIGKTVTDLDGMAGQQEQAVKLVMLNEATYPRSPSSPQLGMNLALAFVLGTGIGIGVALLRYSRLSSASRGRRGARTGRLPAGTRP